MLHPQHSDDIHGGERSLFTLLALYLLLLAFFIVLNSLTHPDASRARNVIRSVQKAFDHEVLALRPRADEEAENGAALAAAAALEELVGALAELQPEVEAQSVAGSTVLRLEIATEPLFAAQGVKLLRDTETLLEGIAHAVKQQAERRIRIETDVLVGVAALQGASPDEKQAAWLSARRAAALVQALIGQGLAAERLASGVTPGLEGRLQFLFRFYDQTPAQIAPLVDRAPEEAG